MQTTVDIVSFLVLIFVLAASVRITLRCSFDRPDNLPLCILTHPAWCIALLLFIPWTIAGFAKGEISYLPWQAFSQYSGNGILDATVFFLCVLVVDLWMFVTMGQLACMLVNESPTLSTEEKASDGRFYIVVNLLLGYLIVMQADNFYHVFQHINTTTSYFMVGIAILAVYFHVRFTPSIIAKAPAILTTCGILGTFLGIAIGLMDFDPNNVQRSVPALIDGIKTAFWASACGVFFALTVKLREVFFGGRALKTKQRATIDDLAALMASVQHALTGKDESSLYSLMVRAREDSNAHLEALTRVMETFVSQQRQTKSLEPAAAHKNLALSSQN